MLPTTQNFSTAWFMLNQNRPECTYKPSLHRSANFKNVHMCTQGFKGLIRDENWEYQAFKLLLVAKLNLYKQHRKNNFQIVVLVFNL